jgi:serine/threonine protein kinase/Tol biopolymer transport system component
MSLDIGTRLGRYEIRSFIGKGGMGVVYSAHDTELDRDVAIKVMPADVSEDVERLSRFKQEAQALARLNHPNILSILDVGSDDGSFYVVSELLEGQTLHDRTDVEKISVRKALDYAVQILRGLAAAHEKGIIHRDLKPENIFITKDGHVKILDFGLAKLVTSEDRESRGSQAPTVRPKTAPGIVMGTISYMSPEQVRGRHDLVDYRSDIFSFGLIFYEMLTGNRALDGDSSADVISAILNDDPPEVRLSNSNLSGILDRIVRRCLEKRPDDRFQSASDVGYAIEALSGMTSPDIRIVERKTSRSRKWWPLFAGLILLALAAAGGIFAGRAFSENPLPSYQQLTFRRGTIWSARFAPDNQTVMYSTAWGGGEDQCYSMRLEALESRQLELSNAEVLAISSTGEMAVLLNRRRIHFYMGLGTLARLPIMGGAPREILEDVVEADWSPDGKELAVVHHVGERRRVEYPIGKVLYETDGWVGHLRISPKGDLIAFLDHQIVDDDRGSVAVVDLGGNKKILSGDWGAVEGLAWSPSGNEVWFTATRSGEAPALYAVNLSGRERVIARAPIGLMLHDISSDGRVLLTRGSFTTDIIGLAPDETKERDLTWLDSVSVFDLSADGKLFIFSYFGEGSGINYTSYMRKTDGSAAIRLGEGAATSLSADGKWAATVLHTPPQIVILPTGTGQPRTLARSGIEEYNVVTWFPDGKRILFTGREPGRGMRCYVQEISDGAKARAVTPEGVVGTQVSPDGKFVIAANTSNQTFLYPLDGGEPLPFAGLAAGEKIIRWTSDGHQLFVRGAEDLPIRVYRLDPLSGRRELVKELMPADRAGLVRAPKIIMAPDGKSYIYDLRRNLSTLFLAKDLK